MWARLALILFCLFLILDASRAIQGPAAWTGRAEGDGAGADTNSTDDATEGEDDDRGKDFTDTAGGAVDNATESIVQTAEEILRTYRKVIYGLLIPLGLLGALFGYYLFSPFMFVGGFVMGGGFFYLAVKASTEGSAHQGWLTLTASILGGLVLGIFAYKAIAVGVFLTGATLGVTIALTLVHTALYSKLDPAKPQVVLYASMGVLGLVTGSLALLMEKEMVIIATSYGGGFATVYGIGHLAGHFPDLDNLDKTNWSSIYPWLYFGSFLFLGSVGCFLQFRFTGKNNDRAVRRRGQSMWRRAPRDEESEEDWQRSPPPSGHTYSRAVKSSNLNVDLTVSLPPTGGPPQGQRMRTYDVDEDDTGLHHTDDFIDDPNDDRVYG